MSCIFCCGGEKSKKTKKKTTKEDITVVNTQPEAITNQPYANPSTEIAQAGGQVKKEHEKPTSPPPKAPLPSPRGVISKEPSLSLPKGLSRAESIQSRELPPTPIERTKTPSTGTDAMAEGSMEYDGDGYLNPKDMPGNKDISGEEIKKTALEKMISNKIVTAIEETEQDVFERIDEELDEEIRPNKIQDSHEEDQEGVQDEEGEEDENAAAADDDDDDDNYYKEEEEEEIDDNVDEESEETSNFIVAKDSINDKKAPEILETHDEDESDVGKIEDDVSNGMKVLEDDEEDLYDDLKSAWLSKRNETFKEISENILPNDNIGINNKIHEESSIQPENNETLATSLESTRYKIIPENLFQGGATSKNIDDPETLDGPNEAKYEEERDAGPVKCEEEKDDFDTMNKTRYEKEIRDLDSVKNDDTDTMNETICEEDAIKIGNEMDESDTLDGTNHEKDTDSGSPKLKLGNELDILDGTNHEEEIDSGSVKLYDLDTLKQEEKMNLAELKFGEEMDEFEKELDDLDILNETTLEEKADSDTMKLEEVDTFNEIISEERKDLDTLNEISYVMKVAKESDDLYILNGTNHEEQTDSDAVGKETNDILDRTNYKEDTEPNEIRAVAEKVDLDIFNGIRYEEKMDSYVVEVEEDKDTESDSSETDEERENFHIQSDKSESESRDKKLPQRPPPDGSEQDPRETSVTISEDIVKFIQNELRSRELPEDPGRWKFHCHKCDFVSQSVVEVSAHAFKVHNMDDTESNKLQLLELDEEEPIYTFA